MLFQCRVSEGATLEKKRTGATKLPFTGNGSNRPKGDPSELKNSDTFGGERSRFLFQATYQFTLGPQNIDSRPSVLGLIKLVPFGTRNVRRFRAHAKVGQLCQFLSSFTSIRKRALRSGPSVECVNLKTLAGSPFIPDYYPVIYYPARVLQSLILTLLYILRRNNILVRVSA